MLRHVILNSGARMPVVGLGTHQMNSRDHQAAFDCALHLGYRLFDTAYSYLNSSLLGEVLDDNVRSGKVKRRDIFITTKIPSVYLAPSDVRDCLSESLEDLKSTYVDLLLIHHPWGLKNMGSVGDKNIYPVDEHGNRILYEHDLNETWKTFEDLVKENKVKNIGVSNFTPSLLDSIISKASIIPANLQLECNAFCQQRDLVRYCQQRNISVTGYASLALTCQQGATETGREGGAEDPTLMKKGVVTEIASRHCKTPAQVLLRYLLQRNICVIPRSNSPKHLQENFDIFSFHLDSNDMAALNGLKKDLKMFTFDWAKRHPLFPKDREPF